jgi:Ca-activated chloride channel family protein
MIHFANPFYLLLLVLIPLIAWWKFFKEKRATMRFSSLENIKKLGTPASLKMYHVLLILQLCALGLFIFGFARPQRGRTFEEIITKGIDIVIALDISSSMKAMDFKPHDRIYVAKEAAANFIKGRKNDRIGLVVFARNSFTQSPLTLDYDIVLKLLKEIKIGAIDDGTAIGMGLATAINNLKNSKAKSRIIVLLTDGRNNAGKIDPMTAAKLAVPLGIKVYTIGAGKPGATLYPVDTGSGTRYVTVRGEEPDEDLLKDISNTTGGSYFRARTPDALDRIFKTINKMEKVEFKTRKYTKYNELFGYFVLLAFAMLALQIILSNTRFRRLP